MVHGAHIGQAAAAVYQHAYGHAYRHAVAMRHGTIGMIGGQFPTY